MISEELFLRSAVAWAVKQSEQAKLMMDGMPTLHFLSKDPTPNKYRGRPVLHTASGKLVAWLTPGGRRLHILATHGHLRVELSTAIPSVLMEE